MSPPDPLNEVEPPIGFNPDKSGGGVVTGVEPIGFDPDKSKSGGGVVTGGVTGVVVTGAAVSLDDFPL